MGPATDWNPAQYLRFQREREQPFGDLLALVQPQPGLRIVDLGCGPGLLTRKLHEALSARETLGLDLSQAMLESARAHAGDGVRFEEGDLGRFAPREKFDLIFSNAALHWVAEHGPVLARLAAALAPGGQLAVQVPDNESHPAHETALEVAAEPIFRQALGGYLWHSPVLPPEEYAAWLHRLGFAAQHVRLQVYSHLLASREEVVEWVKGSLLTAYQKRLPAALFERFVARYRRLLLTRMPDEQPCLLTYRRILFWGRLPSAGAG
ncbi:MAG TPA: methyltransferase domain-containing protein [Myxococcales bacterium]|jgi:trans-aconitate 2-methyltransferase|nr:methyltransferase domain-containing protein [Myxococcales bacterium]